MSNNQKIGLYIHIPFCISKCPYCDFFSIVSHDEKLKSNYVSALLKEIEIYGQKSKDLQIISIYIGGGTPTVLQQKQLKEIISACNHNFFIADGAEISIEANPGTIDGGKIKTLFHAGVNRISIGGQSFNNRILKKIGRIHNKDDIVDTFQVARHEGFKNISIDIMFGLPGESKKGFEKTLEELLILKPEHISLYALTLEPETPFFELAKTGKIRFPSDEFCNELYLNSIKLFLDNGYEHYEISNFALPGKRCVHNMLYWKNKPYLGIGAGATSYIDNKRYKNYQEINHYIHLLKNGILPIKYQEILPSRKRIAETIIMQLRMAEGISKSDLSRQFKAPTESLFYKSFENLKKQGLLAENKTNYFLTKKGILLANNVFIEFLD